MVTQGYVEAIAEAQLRYAFLFWVSSAGWIGHFFSNAISRLGLKVGGASVARGLRSGVKPLKVLGALTDLMAPKHPLLLPTGGYGIREGPIGPNFEARPR